MEDEITLTGRGAKWLAFISACDEGREWSAAEQRRHFSVISGLGDAEVEAAVDECARKGVTQKFDLGR